MRVVQTSRMINVSGFIERLEHGVLVRREDVQFMHIKEPILIQRPQIEDFNSLVVVHDQVEQYV